MTHEQLRYRIEQYIELRRAAGFKMRAEQTLLAGFVSFVAAHPLGLTAQTTVDWACASGCGPDGQAHRLSMARRFLIHLRAFEPLTPVPPPGLLAHCARPRPHIYSDEEIQILLTEAHRLGPTGSLRPDTYATIIGLLASSGLRLGEATALRLDEVNLNAQPARLQVRNAKFNKSRWVVLHPTTAESLSNYARRRKQLGYDGFCDAFFVSEKRCATSAKVVSAAAVRLADRAGLKVHGGGVRKRVLHQLRHTFAVRRLLAWYRTGENVYARMPELSVYLGHRRPEDTYWYLTATPELLRLASIRFEASSGGVR